MLRLFWLLIALLTLLPGPAQAQDDVAAGSQNKPERLAWFQDLGLGLFIHWSVDSQLGSVISHSMVGASEDYLERYIRELPKGFDPEDFDPSQWAELARLAGMKYVVFTTKHHNGFAMFDTETTDFGVMNTPFGRDITKELVAAFREEEIPIGFYFSPDDFHFLHRQGTLISRRRPEAFPQNNPELMQHDREQLQELMRNYGKVDILFIDGPAEGLREVAWEEQPDVVVTRGAIETPEQQIPGEPTPGPWEACFTMGTQWQYKPTNEDYKSGKQLIEMLIETRAKGGNLLINIGPKPDGSIPQEQEDLLRELALWNFVNGEAVEGTRPWTVTNDGPIWYTRKGSTLYAFATDTPWEYASERSYVLESVRATPATRSTGRSALSSPGFGCVSVQAMRASATKKIVTPTVLCSEKNHALRASASPVS